MRNAVAKQIAKLWMSIYKAQYQLRMLKFRRGKVAFFTVLIFLVSLIIYQLPAIQNVFMDCCLAEHTIKDLRSLLLYVGSSLIGATAIIASLVLFAMQVNIERMPYGLFRRLSTDRKLLGAFALAFFLAIAVATLSIVINKMLLVYIMFVALCAILFILWLFRYTYLRALDIVNPRQQLGILVQDTYKKLRFPTFY